MQKRDHRDRLLLVLCCLMWTVGCAGTKLLHWRKPDFPKARKNNPAVRIVALWEPAEGIGLDKLPTRGFAGQVMFFTQKSAAPVLVDGEVRIYLYDDQGSSDEQVKPIHQFDFPAESWAAHVAGGMLGASYQVFIPYTRNHPYQTRCGLRVRLKPKEGPVIYSEMVHVTLPGPVRDGDGVSEVTERPPRSGPDATGAEPDPPRRLPAHSRVTSRAHPHATPSDALRPVPHTPPSVGATVSRFSLPTTTARGSVPESGGLRGTPAGNEPAGSRQLDRPNAPVLRRETRSRSAAASPLTPAQEAPLDQADPAGRIEQAVYADGGHLQTGRPKPANRFQSELQNASYEARIRLLERTLAELKRSRSSARLDPPEQQSSPPSRFRLTPAHPLRQEAGRLEHGRAAFQERRSGHPRLSHAAGTAAAEPGIGTTGSHRVFRQRSEPRRHPLGDAFGTHPLADE